MFLNEALILSIGLLMGSVPFTRGPRVTTKVKFSTLFLYACSRQSMNNVKVTKAFFLVAAVTGRHIS